MNQSGTINPSAYKDLVTAKYDHQLRFESVKRSNHYPIHKKLKLEEHSDMLDWIVEKVHFEAGDQVLDAGCGTGYSLIKLNKEKEVSGLGISLSPQEISYANQGANDQIRFKVWDFNEPLGLKFDKIIAIESLRHSPLIDQTINNLVASLSPGGFMIIADDFMKNTCAEMDILIKLVSAHYYSITRLEEMLLALGRYKMRVYDFSNRVPVRSKWKLDLLITGLKLGSYLPLGVGFKRNIKTYLGGFIQERLYLTDHLSYCIVIIEKEKG